MAIILMDCETHQRVDLPDCTRCVCCGAHHDCSPGASRAARLVIDHDRWQRKNGRFPTRVLCGYCNIRKGRGRSVPFGSDWCWVPGMKSGELIPNIFCADTRRRLGRVLAIPIIKGLLAAPAVRDAHVFDGLSWLDAIWADASFQQPKHIAEKFFPTGRMEEFSKYSGAYVVSVSRWFHGDRSDPRLDKLAREWNPVARPEPGAASLTTHAA